MATWCSLSSTGRTILCRIIRHVPSWSSCPQRPMFSYFTSAKNNGERLPHFNTSLLLSLTRCSTVFTSLPADQLWEGVTGPRGSTKKRARGKRRVTRPKVDLHVGQRLGMGKEAMEWPGLNVPLMDRNAIRSIRKVSVLSNYGICH